MNVRVLVLVLVALSVGSVLTWLAWGGAERGASGGQTVENGGAGDSPRDDAPSDRSSNGSRTSLHAPTFGWDVIVVGPDGTALPEAEVRVSSGDEIHVSTGRSRFDGLAAGGWRLVVTCDGYPAWDETIVLDSTRDTRTRVRLDTVVHVSCKLLDQRGEPIVGETVHALRSGEAHPATGYESRTAVHARTGAGGSFRIELPEAGDWTFSVGPPADAARFVSDLFEARHGRERSCQLVVPAHARLEVTTTPSGDHVGGNVLFVLADRREPQAPTAGTNDADSDSGAAGVDAPSKGVETSGKDGVTSAADAATEFDGWSTVGRKSFLDGDSWTFADLPERELLRFRLLRGSESLVIIDSVLAPAAATVHLHLEPPSPLPSRQVRPAKSRVCPARLRIEPLDPDDALEIGLTWQGK